MAYDKQKIYNEILEIIDKEDLTFIEECCAYVGISRETFYRYYPIGSDENDTIKNKLQSRKSKNIHSVTKQWKESDNPTLQIAYVKINGSDEIRKRLSNSYIEKTDMNVNGDGTQFTITRKVISDESDEQ